MFSFAASKPARPQSHHHTWKWVTGLYLAGVLAHFSHHMVDLPDGSDPSFEALTSAPLKPCLARRLDRDAARSRLIAGNEKIARARTKFGRGRSQEISGCRPMGVPLGRLASSGVSRAHG